MYRILRDMELVKRFVLLALCASVFVLTGCKKQEIPLTVWVDTGNVDVIKSRLDEFAKKNSSKCIFKFNIIEQNSSKTRNVLFSGHGDLPDVFCFTDSQMKELCDKGYLKELSYNKYKVIADCGGESASVVQASMTNGKLYAYPELNSDGYFLYYNKAYFEPSDLNSFERIAEVAASNGKKVSMDLQNSWYLYSFFKAAGLDIYMNEDGMSNTCNWNSKAGPYTGLDVARAIENLARLPGFETASDSKFISLIEMDEIIAGVNGAWNSQRVAELWGDNYAACKLPCIRIAGDDLQMHSYAGFKFVGVSSSTRYPEWAEKVAEWITNEKSQLMIYENTGECPANLKAARSSKVMASPAIRALSEQSEFSHRQIVYKSVWKPAKLFGVMLTENHLSDEELQKELDNLVVAISGK